MAFSQATIDAAYQRAGGRCECTMSSCTHHADRIRCNASLANGWHAHHRRLVSEGGGDNFSNCLLMCTSCHENAYATAPLQTSFQDERSPVSPQE